MREEMREPMRPEMHGGVEWIVDAVDLDPARISGRRGLTALRALFEELVSELDLHPLGAPQWFVFGANDPIDVAEVEAASLADGGGVTGLVALSESHLACHTYPETGTLTINLYTCRARPTPDWKGLVQRFVGPAVVRAESVARGRRAVRPEGTTA